MNDFSGGQYSFNKNITFNTPLLRLHFSDYSDAYIVVKGKITFKGTDDASKINKNLTFKKNPPFRSSISKINNKFVYSVEVLDIFMLMYILLEYR